jgi:PAS domain S-box-containing protein
MTGSPKARDESGTIQPGEPTVIYPLVSGSGNDRVLKEWIAGHDSYLLANDDRPIVDAEFDVCVVDKDGLQQYKDDLKQVKSAAKPALLPVLLLLSEHQSDIIETDRGEIADNVLVSTVDEIVSLPIRQAELEWRIGALLRLRDQSLDLQTQTRQLRRFQEAVEASGHAIFITDADGTIEYVNTAFEEITGYSRAEVMGETPDILNSGKMSVEYYEELWETISSGSVWEGEIVDRRKDGELYTAYQTIAPITDDSEVSAFVAVQTDITERKELRDRLKRHRDIVQRLEDPIMLQDETGAFELVNEALVDFAGCPEAELLGGDEHQFMDEATADLIERRKSEVFETESPVQYAVSPTFERSNEEAVFSTRRYPYYDDDDDLAGTLAICRDVTDLEERTRQLQVIDNILRHNLRNDLTVIRGLAEQIHRQTTGTTAKTAERIVTHTDDLMQTGEKSRAITDLLSEDSDLKPLDVTATVRSIAKEINGSRSDVQLDIDVPDRAFVSTTLKIREAIEELVRNAINHNDRETPSVEISIGTNDETVGIHVIDDGPGIPEMDRDVLETGRAIDDLYHGSGLGLWLVYWIVNRSNGSIEVTERDPRGTDVTLTLPRCTETEA